MSWDPHFDRFFGSYSKLGRNGKNGPNIGFNRLAIQHIVLGAGDEKILPTDGGENFLFVLRGQPQLQLNATVHALDVGYAAALPAAPIMLFNPTASKVHVLLAQHTSGQPSETISLLNCPEQPRRRPFSYPGDNEAFGEGFRISDKIGLKTLGAWYDYLPPGRRTAFPHAHTHEEEFVFIIKGRPLVWLNGHTQQMEAESFAAFPSHTGIAHTLINDTEEDVIYLCLGEATDFAAEKISYPLHPLRRDECLRKGWYWTDLPAQKMGDHPGHARRPPQGHLYFRPCTTDDAEMVFDVFQKSPTYFQRVDGCAPTLQMARLALVDAPKKTCAKYFKHFLTVHLDNEVVGVVDLHPHHPEEGVCYLGLLLIKEDLFGLGLGTKCFQLAEDYIRRALGCQKIRLGVSDENDVTAFWQKMGFTANGKTYEWKGEDKISTVREFDKIL